MKNQQLRQTAYLKRLQMLHEAKYTVLFLLIIFIFAFAVMSCVYNVFVFFNCCEIYEFKNISMSPTINNYEDNDFGIINTKAEIEVGKVITCTVVSNMEILSVTKRVVAVGGDKITVVKQVNENGVSYFLQCIPKGLTTPYIMQEDYLLDKSKNKDVYDDFQVLYERDSIQTEIHDGQRYIVIPDNCMFVLGDNRNNSQDSSEYGPININTYTGTVVYHIREGKNLYLYQILYALGLIGNNI